MSLLRFVILLVIKVLSRVFYRFDVGMIGDGDPGPGWRDVTVGLLLNHTSLFEPLYVGALPLSLLWRLATKGIFPAADVTMDRPLVGRFLNLLAPRVVSITRKRDDSWQTFLGQIDGDGILIIAPEGRMKRPDGLDRHGKPMTVKGGVVDAIQLLSRGTMLIAYSGGLHHVQIPGQGFPKLFKTLKIRFEALKIESYLAAFTGSDSAIRLAIIRDLEARRDRYC